jgi:hypothetical protein
MARTHRSSSAQELAVDAWGGRGALRDLTGRSSEWRSDRCGRATRSSGNNDLSSDESEFLRKRNPK